VHLPKVAIRQEADLKYQSISDAVALSAAPNAAGLDALCTAAEELSRMLLRSGYFPRGGITKGSLYHDHSMVFGPALIAAYRLETEVAKYPRILIPRSVASASTLYAQEGTHWKEPLRTASSKRVMVHSSYMSSATNSRRTQALARNKPGASANEDAQLIPIILIGRAVQRRYDEASDNPDHFQKIDWFARYWNTRMSHGPEGLEPIMPRPL
jgi:hypothetical protein